MGISRIYDFESDDEGFSTNEPSNTTVTLEYTFEEWENPTTGTSPSSFYNFEFVESKYNFVSGINSYSAAKLDDIEDYPNIKKRSDDRFLEEVTIVDIYGNVVFRGETK